MIKVTLGVLNNDLFWGALESIMGQDCKVSVSMQIIRIQDALRKEAQLASRGYAKLIQKYAELDDKGNIKTKVVQDQGLKKPAPVIREDIDKEEYKKDLIEFLSSVVTIDLPKLKVQDLMELNLSPKHLKLIESILDYSSESSSSS